MCALLVGLRGSGKSNLLNVFIAQLGRCVDTMTFMIDLKGGRAAYPWIRPWLEGRCPRPVIDWVASDRAEAERMLQAVLRAVTARAHSGGGGEKITPSAAVPAIILIIDEMAVIFGLSSSRQAGSSNVVLAQLGTRIVQLSRSEAIDLILATQRGTVTMTGGGDLKSQCGLRIGLGVASEADARYIIPDNASVARLLPRLQHPGTGIVSAGDARIAPVKFDRLEPEQIDDIAARLGYVRPELDAVTMAALGDDYAERWTAARAGHIPGFQRAVVAQGARGGASGDIDWEQQFSEMTAGLDISPDGERPLHPARLRMLELLDKAAVMGMTPARIQSALAAEGLGVVRQTIQKWLAEETETGRLVRASHGRYKSTKGRP
jgi:hypothetical protein